VLGRPLAELSEGELVGRCLQGDEYALNELVARHQATVFGTALRLVGEREVALEIANQALFKAVRALHRFDRTRPLKPWLAQIAANEAISDLRLRREEQARILDGEAGERAMGGLSGGTEPESAVVAGEERARVRRALLTLPERYRLVLVLRFFDDLSYQEIAARTGQSVNTVGVQLLRARALLRQALKQEVGEP